jgi:hypothetical protein
MSAETCSTEALASRCGVAVRTIHRWRKRPGFPSPVKESADNRDEGHEWDFTAIRSWLDEQGEWDWAMDRAFAADKSEHRSPPSSRSVEALIETGLAHDQAKVRQAAGRAVKAVEALRELVDNDKERREAEAEVERLTKQLAEAKARLRSPRSVATGGALRTGRNQENREQVRAWAREQGIPVRDKGAISVKIMREYEAALGSPAEAPE